MPVLVSCLRQSCLRQSCLRQSRLPPSCLQPLRRWLWCLGAHRRRLNICSGHMSPHLFSEPSLRLRRMQFSCNTLSVLRSWAEHLLWTHVSSSIFRAFTASASHAVFLQHSFSSAFVGPPVASAKVHSGCEGRSKI